jgi:hypothetical protein
MDPGALLRPVGPLPPRVYWWRRSLPLLLVLVVVLLLAYACSGDPAPRRAGGVTTPTPTPTASPSRSAAAGGSRPASACRPAQLLLVAATDAGSYAAGIRPRLTLSLRLRGSAPCVVDDSARSRAWEVWSGNDRIFTTGGCPTPPPSHRVRLGPNQPVAHTLVWDRRRADRGCSPPGRSAQPGTYRLYVRVSGVPSAAAVFHLTA